MMKSRTRVNPPPPSPTFPGRWNAYISKSRAVAKFSEDYNTSDPILKHWLTNHALNGWTDYSLKTTYLIHKADFSSLTMEVASVKGSMAEYPQCRRLHTIVLLLSLVLVSLYASVAITSCMAQSTDSETDSRDSKVDPVSQAKSMKLFDELKQYIQNRDLESSLETIEKILDFEFGRYGRTTVVPYNTLRFAAIICEKAGDLESQIRYLRRAADYAQGIVGFSKYQKQDARRAVNDAVVRLGLTSEQSQEFEQSRIQAEKFEALYDAGRYREALPVAEAVLEVRSRILPESHTLHFTSLMNLALLRVELGEFKLARPLYEQALAIQQRVLGDEHPIYATTLNNFGDCFQHLGDLTQAGLLYRQSMQIRKRVLGTKHFDYAESLVNLAQWYSTMGDFARAERLNLEAVDIIKSSVGTDNQAYATSLANLAGFYERVGDYATAEPLYQEAKEIRGRQLGNEHPEYVASVSNLAVFYDLIGDHARALPLHQMVKDARLRTLGIEHPDYASSLGNLASCYHDMGELIHAKSLYQDLLKIVERSLGTDHLDYAYYLNDLAMLHRSMNEYLLAESAFRQSLAIKKRIVGSEHPAYANTLNNLAVLYVAMDDYPRAERLFKRVLKMRGKLFGDGHPFYGTSLNNLATLNDFRGSHGIAMPMHLRALDLSMAHVNRTFIILSEQQQIAMAFSVRHHLDVLIACVIAGNLPTEEAITQHLLWKGSALVRARAIRVAATDPKLAARFTKLRSLSARYASMLKQVPDDDKQLRDWRVRLDEVLEEQRRLEVEISGENNDFAATTEPPSLEEIRAGIPTGGVLVNYIEYGSKLAAAVIPREGKLELVALGSTDAIEQAVTRWRKTFGQSEDSIAAGKELHERLWEPIAEHLDGIQTVLISPTGPLGQFPFAALPGSQPDTYLIEDHLLVHVPVPRLLASRMMSTVSEVRSVADTTASKKEQYELLLLGDVDYSRNRGGARQRTPDQEKRFPGELIAMVESPGFQGNQMRAALSFDSQWKALPGTAVEIEFIADLFDDPSEAKSEKSRILTLIGSEANEEYFSVAAPRCRVLHVATHGFFADPSKKSALSHFGEPDSSGLVNQNARLRELGDDGDIDSVRLRQGTYPPGLLSGLVLAGANEADAQSRSEVSSGPHGDGILTSQEIAYLPMGKVELAVLSACETGLGLSAGGEGLLGIQRAFQVAGVDATIASLWKVDDWATRELMERFYENQLERGLNPADALRRAQLWMLKRWIPNHPESVRGVSRTDNVDFPKRTPPKYWAAFVLSGDWR